MKQFPIPILYFSNEPTRGGAEEHLLTLLRGLDRNYFQPLLACPSELAEKLRPDLPSDVEVFPISLRKLSHAGAMLRLARILRERAVKILHSHLFYASLFASPIAWMSGVPVIIETPHVREDWRRGWLKSKFVVDRIVSRFVTRYIAVSHANKRYLAEEKGLAKEKIIVIHNGSDLRRFRPGQTLPSNLRQSLGLGMDDPVLMVVGRLEPQKGHKVLFEAMPSIRREFSAVRLVCVGTGSLHDALSDLARKLGIEDAVRFVGFQTDVAEWLNLADVTVLPSFFEGLPLVAIESLAATKPVVATAVDGSGEVVVNGETGLTVPPGNPQALSEAVCRLLRDAELRKTLGRQGREWVCKHFDEREQIKQTQDLYLSALECATQGVGTAVRVEHGETKASPARSSNVEGRR
jgi:glycosyltransferase involved in cell wall biosynthesis